MNLSQHTLRSYDKQLQNLLQLILEMGGQVRTQIVAVRESFRAPDEKRVNEAKEADKHINELDRRIEEEATVILALQNPLAIDLRFVISVLKITGMLERAGDYAKNTVKRSLRMGKNVPEEVLQKFEHMTDVIVEMLDLALEAFAEKDTQKASIVWQRDEEVDTLYREVTAIMQKSINDSPDNATAFIHVVFAAKNLERLADYTASIAKTVYYVASGRRADKAMLKELSENPVT